MVKPLRKIADPFVVASPAGLRIRTRLHPTRAEAEALKDIGRFLGGLYRAELAGRVAAGRLAGPRRAEWRRERKRTVTAVTSSRWAGAIIRAVEDQYQLGMRSAAADVAFLSAAVDAVTRRCAVEPGTVAAGVRGYHTAAERHQKRRRLTQLQHRLRCARTVLDQAHPSITVGGNHLWRNRNHLDRATLTEAEWGELWSARRAFFTADGESGKRLGNETIRVDGTGQVTIKVPAALADTHGSRLALTVAVGFTHRAGQWLDRVMTNKAVRYDITYDVTRARWYLDASWAAPTEPVPPLATLQAGRVVGVDLNANHLACTVLDFHGNVLGQPVTIPLDLAGVPATTRDGRLRFAISSLIELAHRSQCPAVVIENLNFTDARSSGRETMGRGQRGKRFRRTVSGIPTARFRDRLAGMTATAGLHLIAVDPAYTSRWGSQHWTKPVQQQAVIVVTRHHAAATAIARRGKHLPIRRRTTGPRNGQRTVSGFPPPRPPRQQHLPPVVSSSAPPVIDQMTGSSG